MKINDQIKYPVDLGTWRIRNIDQNRQPHDMRPYYGDWENDTNQPEAGNFGAVVFDLSGGGGKEKTYNWHAIWSGDGQLALWAEYNGLYAWTDAGHLGSRVALTNGSAYDNQRSNFSYDPNGRFTLVNLKSGNIAIQRNGKSMSFLYDSPDPVNDPDDSNDGKHVAMVDHLGAWETLRVVGSHFPILLITKTGNGLTLAGQDLGAEHYLENITDVDFSWGDLKGANFSTLRDPNLAGCNFTGVSMSRAILKGCRNLNRAIWDSADLSSTDLSHIDKGGTAKINFHKTNLQGATLSNGQPLAANFDYGEAQFIDANLAGANLENLNLRGANFEKAILTGANLKGANLTDAIFSKANLKGAHLDGADLTGARLTDAHLDGATLANTNLTNTHLENTKFRGCDLSSTIFSPAPNFGGSVSSRTSFQNAANLPAAKLGSKWAFLDLRGAHLTDIPKDLTGLDARHTLFPDKVNLSGVCFKHGQFEKAQMFYANLTRSDLSYANLDNTFLKGATLTRANLCNASMKGTWLIAKEGINDHTKFEAAKAPEAFLINTNLDGAHCDGVDFTGILFLTDPAVSMQPASANGAFMNRVDFSDARIIGVSFRGTQLAGTHFDNAMMMASSFPSAQITPTSDKDHSAPTMRKADLRGVQFADVTQKGTSNPANLDGLDMLGATYSAKGGMCEIDYKDFYDSDGMTVVNYGPTVPGETTASTVCPDGNKGPCAWEMAAERVTR